MPPRSNWLYPAAGVLAACVPVALVIDLPIADFFATTGLPGELRKIVNLAEIFGHGWGVVLILLVAVFLDPRHGRVLPRLAACAYLPGLAANLLKITVSRTRPRAFDGLGGVTETFCGWLPLVHHDSLSAALDHDIQSFPSGHTATAFGLAIGLGYLYPRGRLLFAVFAILVAVQRMSVAAHYLSDTLAAGGLACLMAGFLVDPIRGGKWFARIESPSRDACQGNSLSLE